MATGAVGLGPGGVAAAAAPWVPAGQIVVNRLNNVTAYAANAVMSSSAVDGRINMSGFFLPGRQVTGIRVATLQTRPGTDAVLNVGLNFFSAQPATVLGDGAALNLSDPDIANLFWWGTQTPMIFWTINNSPSETLNPAAGIAGRRFSQQALTAPTGPTPAVLWAYLVTAAAYVPLALETITFNFFVQYGS